MAAERSSISGFIYAFLSAEIGWDPVIMTGSVPKGEKLSRDEGTSDRFVVKWGEAVKKSSLL